MVSGFFIDTNLLVVGNADLALVARHKRLKSYAAGDYRALLDLINLADRVFMTPNTLTEASNLLGQHGKPERSQLMAGLRALIDGSDEIVIPSAPAAANPEFQRLGLTDAALLEAVSEETPLITADSELYSAASAKGQYAAWDFRREREVYQFRQRR